MEWRFADGKYERFPELAAELVDQTDAAGYDRCGSRAAMRRHRWDGGSSPDRVKKRDVNALRAALDPRLRKMQLEAERGPPHLACARKNFAALPDRPSKSPQGARTKT